MFLNLGHKKARLMDHFIPGEGINVIWFEENYSRYLGDIEWTLSTNMENGKEGFLCRVYEPIKPEVLFRLRKDACEAKKQMRNDAQRVYFEKLQDSWKEEEAREKVEKRRRKEEKRRTEGANLNIPVLQLPPTYSQSEGVPSPVDTSQPVWDHENCAWTYAPTQSTGASRFTRSTPATPVSPPRDSYWNTRPQSSNNNLSPVSPTEGHGTFSSMFRARPSGGVIAHHDREVGIRRPRSAVEMRQSSTAQVLLNISQSSYSWI